MIYFLLYYIIGFITSSYMIWNYRFSNKTKREQSKLDSLGGLIGPFIFPLQIWKHIKYLNSLKK